MALSKQSCLPIGSVVTLKNTDFQVVIFGIMQVGQNAVGRPFDYIGVPYPQGNIGEAYQFLFDKDDIENVIFVGYSDEHRDRFLETIADVFPQEDQ